MNDRIKFFLSFVYVILPISVHYIKRIFGFSQSKILILYYHSFPEEFADQFIFQLETLQKMGKIISVKKRMLDPSNDRLYAITIDDGLVSILNYALPELKKRAIPCVIFLPSGFIGLKPKWEEYGNEILTSETVLNHNQIKALDNGLFEIGSHTINHPKLSQIPLAQQVYEINESKKQLEEILDYQIKKFSFPYGDYNEQLVKICQDAGYDLVFNTEPRFNITTDKNFLYGRVPVEPSDSQLRFMIKILGGYNWLGFYLSIKKKLSNLL